MAHPTAVRLALLLTIVQATAVFSLSASSEPLLSGSPEKLHRSDFPKDFVFGTSTSAYQTEGALREGGRGPSVWDVWSHTPGIVYDGSNADVAVDEYHLYEEDVDMVSSLNMDAYRFSVSWTRIFPDGVGPEVNKEGVAYYNALIDSLLRKGIKPYITIFHWDLPVFLQDSMGGWFDRRIVDYYVMFADACFAAFGDRVKNWITINEPSLYTSEGYSSGEYPPGRSSDAETEVYIVGHNFLLAHAAAVNVYRTKYQAEQKGEIGITLECQFAFPLTNSSEDKEAAQRILEFQVGWFLDPIYFGDYPAIMRTNVADRLPKFSAEDKALLKGSLDFIGLNHYTSRYATTGPGPLPNSKSSMVLDRRVTMTAVGPDGVNIGPQAASTWLYIVPQGLYGLLKWTSERYNAPIVVTENGMDYVGSLTNETNREENIHDDRRVQFYKEYVAAALQAIREGVDVRAYFAWALLDCYEWVSGYTKRFGIVYVDYDDGLKRYPKDSALWFKEFLHRSQADA